MLHTLIMVVVVLVVVFNIGDNILLFEHVNLKGLFQWVYKVIAALKSFPPYLFLTASPIYLDLSRPLIAIYSNKPSIPPNRTSSFERAMCAKTPSPT